MAVFDPLQTFDTIDAEGGSDQFHGMKQGEFQSLLAGPYDSSSLVLANGTRFIRKLPGKGSLAYLHTLYAPLEASRIAALQTALKRHIDPQLADFLGRANGANLFANTISLFGFGDNYARSLKLEDQAAISIVWENEVFAAVAPDRWGSGWIQIGGLVGWNSSWSVEIHSSGTCAVRGEEGGGSKTYPGLNDCLDRVASRIGQCFSFEGIVDETYAELEAALTSLVYEG